MTEDYWNTDRTAILRHLWADGSTAAQIAKHLGNCSRSAVLGKAFRLGLVKRRGAREAALQAGTAKRLNRNRRAKTEHVLRRRPPTPSPTEEARANAWAALPGTQSVTLLELEPGMCKWPIGKVGPYRFCGAHTQTVYCEHHQGLSTNASR